MLSNIQKSQIKEWALKNPNEETCGLIYISGENINISKCKNIASNKKEYFEIDPLSYLRISNNKKNQIIGIFHSQVMDQPSELDYMVAKSHNCKSIIYCVKTDEFFEVEDLNLKYTKYLYRPFIMGKDDCLSLIIDFYKNEYNINITNFPREEDWYKNNPNIIEENIEKENFIIIKELKDVKEGDILVFKNKIYKHLGIYLEKNLVLHSPYHKKSMVEKLNNESKEKIKLILRHKSKI